MELERKLESSCAEISDKDRNNRELKEEAMRLRCQVSRETNQLCRPDDLQLATTRYLIEIFRP